MSTPMLLSILFGAGIVVVLALLYVIFALQSSKKQNQLRNMTTPAHAAAVAAASSRQRGGAVGVQELGVGASAGAQARGKPSLAKKLRYARWKLPAWAFRLLGVTISVIMLLLVMAKFNYLVWFCALVSGPLFMGWLLERKVQARFKKFDSDYPQMLMSLVGLLKTGMNPMNALDSCADGLEINSTVRQEIKLMVERLRFGVTEDKSIGAFAEDIFHPEKELFVQALLLSRRVGGTLSHTLERLAKQARKRQYFRQSAQAAVGMQRGSINFIVAILAALELYVYFMYPEVIQGALDDPLGWQVYQTGIVVVLLGMYWVRQVTKIKV